VAIVVACLAGQAEGARGEAQTLVTTILVRSPWALNTELLWGRENGRCEWYDWSGGEWYRACPENVRAPSFWKLYWTRGKPCQVGTTGQPEARMTSPLMDPGRGQSFLWFTFWRCQSVRLEQRLPEELDGRVRVTARLHVWYSDCSGEPFGPPLHRDCVTPWTGRLEVRAGVGRRASAWKANAYCSGEPCWHDVTSPWVEVDGFRSIWIESRSDYPAKHENVYVESITLEVEDD